MRARNARSVEVSLGGPQWSPFGVLRVLTAMHSRMPSARREFQRLVDDRGAALRLLPFGSLLSLDEPTATVVVKGRMGRIDVLVERTEDERVLVVLKGLLDGRFFKSVKAVAMHGFLEARIRSRFGDAGIRVRLVRLARIQTETPPNPGTLAPRNPGTRNPCTYHPISPRNVVMWAT